MNAVAYLTPPGELEHAPEDLEIIAVVVDDDPHGLSRALHWIASGDAQVLYVPRLNLAAGSLGELVRLLDWLVQAGAHLVAADVGLDTRQRGGRRSVELLREIERWGRDPGPSKRPRGRPGLSAGSPVLAERIATMREGGLSLAAIAAALNEEGVPTPRGGSHWRPSSVQAALGYRRPRPPAPGAPPAGPPKPKAPPRGGPRHKPPKPRPPRS